MPTQPLPAGKRWKFVLGILAVVFGVGAFHFIRNAAFIALDSDRTRDAQRLALDVLGRYCVEYQTWPKSWDDLASVSAQSESWNWPADSGAIRERIDVEFAVSLADVLRLNSGNFTLVRPRRFSAALAPSEIEQFLARLPRSPRARSD